MNMWHQNHIKDAVTSCLLLRTLLSHNISENTITLYQLLHPTIQAQMSSNAAKKIVVFTATGSQGSSVARYLSEAGYKVVALTRDTESKSAKGEAGPFMSSEQDQSRSMMMTFDSSQGERLWSCESWQHRPRVLQVCPPRSLWCFCQHRLWVPSYSLFVSYSNATFSLVDFSH